MLTIRQDQFAVLNLQTALAKRRIFLYHARTYHPAACERFDEDALNAHITAILTAGAKQGIVATKDFLTFLDLAMVFGLDWSDQRLQWLEGGLRERAGGNISERLHKLRLEAIYRMEVESVINEG